MPAELTIIIEKNITKCETRRVKGVSNILLMSATTAEAAETNNVTYVIFSHQPDLTGLSQTLLNFHNRTLSLLTTESLTSLIFIPVFLRRP
jgi:hypothetical protein